MRISKKCVHSWEEVRRHHTPPLNPSRMSVDSIEIKMLSRILFGVTSVEMQCIKCHDVKFVEAFGDAR